MVQNKNRMVKPLDRALMIFTPRAASEGEKGRVKSLPSNTNKGAPGG
jgi:hypothetical protein